jgi:hypothetical protein
MLPGQKFKLEPGEPYQPHIATTYYQTWSIIAQNKDRVKFSADRRSVISFAHDVFIQSGDMLRNWEN